MLDNELQALNQQVNSHTIRSPTPVSNKTHKMNKYVDMAKKCCKIANLLTLWPPDDVIVSFHQVNVQIDYLQFIKSI